MLIRTEDSKELSQVIVENPGGIDGADTSSKGFWVDYGIKLKGRLKRL